LTHTLPALPYSHDALMPHISPETLEYHWGKHHRAYVDNLNLLVAGTAAASSGLEDLIRRSSGAIFNNAAQHFNHSFYWDSLSPRSDGHPTGPLAEAIRARYGSFDEFRTAFSQQANSHFGSGWCWLVCKRDKRVQIELTHDAGNPLQAGDTPILACDLWEHAYYIDYRNARLRYLEAFWSVANWRFARDQFEKCLSRSVVSA
jgi:superoxide dismutase, Fe-Mn family